jgi:hypothetical protein
VDGSFSEALGKFSYGVIFFYKKEGCVNELRFSKAFSNPELLEMRNVAGEIMGAKTAIDFCLRNGIDAGAPSFAAVRQEALVQLNNAYSFVTSAKAHCVCRMCQGNGCKACHNRGWQTEEEYDRNPKEFKHGN